MLLLVLSLVLELELVLVLVLVLLLVLLASLLLVLVLFVPVAVPFVPVAGGVVVAATIPVAGARNAPPLSTAARMDIFSFRKVISL